MEIVLYSDWLNNFVTEQFHFIQLVIYRKQQETKRVYFENLKILLLLLPDWELDECSKTAANHNDGMGGK